MVMRWCWMALSRLAGRQPDPVIDALIQQRGVRQLRYEDYDPDVQDRAQARRKEADKVVKDANRGISSVRIARNSASNFTLSRRFPLDFSCRIVRGKKKRATPGKDRARM